MPNKNIFYCYQHMTSGRSTADIRNKTGDRQKKKSEGQMFSSAVQGS